MTIETEQAGAAEAAEPTLRESLTAAFASSDEGGQRTDAAGQAEHADAAAAGAQERPAGERQRDASGRFAAAAAEQTRTTDQPAGAAAEPQGQPEVLRAPGSWTAAAKAKWATLDPVVQAEIGKRETDIARGMTQREQQIQRYKPIDDILAPHRERIALNGQTEATYVGALVAADEMLRGPRKIEALQHLARIYDIQLPQAGQGQPGAQQAQPHPQVAELQREVQALRQAEQQRSSAQASAAQQHIDGLIQAFADDPKNIYFENVKADMGVLLQSGSAKTMEQAYDMACHMRPDIRALVAGQSGAVAADPARQRASAARQASGSVTGAPGPGSSARGAPSPNETLRDTLRAAYRAAS